jgi:hypothetical protein
MKNTLAENMLRFGVKNLKEPEIKKIEKLAEQGYMGNVAPDQKGAATPQKIVLSSNSRFGTSEGWRMTQFNRKDQSGASDYIWDIVVILNGTPGQLTTKSIDFVPSLPELKAKNIPTITVPLKTPLVIAVPLDYRKAIYGQDKLKLAPVNLATDNNFKQVYDQINQFAVLQGQSVDFIASVLNGNIADGVLMTLANLSAEKGWYTGPKQTVAKQYALFVNHNGNTVS